MNSTGPDTGGDSVVLYSTRRSIATSIVAAALLVSLSVYGLLLAGRPAPFALLLLLLGILLSWVALFDHPHSAIFDGDGVTRRCLLRRHRLRWTDVTSLSRSRGNLVGSPRHHDTPRRSAGLGGLIVEKGRRKYLLVSHCEGSDEFDQVRRLLTTAAPTLPFRAKPPPEHAPPTWLARRRPRPT